MKRRWRRPCRSSAISAITITSITQAICAAPGRLDAIDPGGEDRQGQRLHAEIFAGADVVQGFEQRQRKPDRERGPCERQRHMPRQHHAARAERARHFDQRGALGEEHRARGEIDVRIEHEAHHEDRARQRADRRETSIPPPCDSRTGREMPTAPGPRHRKCRHRHRRRYRSGRRAAAAAASTGCCGRENRARSRSRRCRCRRSRSGRRRRPGGPRYRARHWAPHRSTNAARFRCRRAAR